MPDDRARRRSPAEIERDIVDRREHLVATLDELSRRLQPAELAASARSEATASVRSLVVDPASGKPRVERLAAVAAAATVLVVLVVAVRVRGRRGR